MNYTISFQERAQLALEQLSNQLPVTLAMARQQARKLKTQSIQRTRNKEVRSLLHSK